jgi:hypothetical protein
MEASGRKHGALSCGTKLPRSSTFEWPGRIDDIRSWSRLVKHHAARFAATALAGSLSSRTWYSAHAHSLIATHQCVRIARDEALTVVSAITVRRRLTPSACTVDPLTAGRIRGPPRTQPASRLRHETTASDLHVLRGRRRIQQFAVGCAISKNVAQRILPAAGHTREELSVRIFGLYRFASCSRSTSVGRN